MHFTVSFIFYIDIDIDDAALSAIIFLICLFICVVSICLCLCVCVCVSILYVLYIAALPALDTKYVCQVWVRQREYNGVASVHLSSVI